MTSTLVLPITRFLKNVSKSSNKSIKYICVVVVLHIFTLPAQNNTFIKICNTVYAGIKLANSFISNSEHSTYTTGSKGVRLLLYRVYLGTQHIGPRPTGSFCSTALCIWVCNCMYNSEVSKWRVGTHCLTQIDLVY